MVDIMDESIGNMDEAIGNAENRQSTNYQEL